MRYYLQISFKLSYASGSRVMMSSTSPVSLAAPTSEPPLDTMWQLLQQHVHHGALLILLEGLRLLGHLLCFCSTLSLQSKGLCLTLHLKERTLI
ncbi:hypothetical protein JZ751_000617 [Albula glossodonta]|uniref:Uncharacterized protein n=1 Tax=Albula glossodonta TaxID=121402 RepID=A0A8T2PX33_9TELE|nr:hypothetical protein JZ751_000617 [Albula glossodonta]